LVNNRQTPTAPLPSVVKYCASSLQEFPISTNGAFQKPFANVDFSKIFDSFKIPNVDMASAAETGQKNFAAVTAMNTAAFGSITAIARRQSEMMRTAMEDFAKHGSEMLAAGTLEEKTAKQIDFAKKSYDAAIAHTKELAELYTKSQAETLAAIQERVTALSEEVKTVIAKKERPPI